MLWPAIELRLGGVQEQKLWNAGLPFQSISLSLMFCKVVWYHLLLKQRRFCFVSLKNLMLSNYFFPRWSLNEWVNNPCPCPKAGIYCLYICLYVYMQLWMKIYTHILTFFYCSSQISKKFTNTSNLGKQQGVYCKNLVRLLQVFSL